MTSLHGKCRYQLFFNFDFLLSLFYKQAILILEKKKNICQYESCFSAAGTQTRRDRTKKKSQKHVHSRGNKEFHPGTVQTKVKSIGHRKQGQTNRKSESCSVH